MSLVLQPPVSNVARGVTAPGAGNDWSYTCPDNQILKIRSIMYSFGADANAANRIMQITINDASNDFLTISSSPVIVANKGFLITWMPNAPLMEDDETDAKTYTLHDDIFLYPGWILKGKAINKQAGDLFTAIWILVHQYLTPSVA